MNTGLVGRRRKGTYEVIIPTWKIAEVAGVSTSAVARAMLRGRLRSRRFEDVVAWLRARDGSG